MNEEVDLVSNNNNNNGDDGDEGGGNDTATTPSIHRIPRYNTAAPTGAFRISTSAQILKGVRFRNRVLNWAAARGRRELSRGRWRVQWALRTSLAATLAALLSTTGGGENVHFVSCVFAIVLVSGNLGSTLRCVWQGVTASVFALALSMACRSLTRAYPGATTPLLFLLVWWVVYSPRLPTPLAKKLCNVTLVVNLLVGEGQAEMHGLPLPVMLFVSTAAACLCALCAAVVPVPRRAYTEANVRVQFAVVLSARLLRVATNSVTSEPDAAHWHHGALERVLDQSKLNREQLQVLLPAVSAEVRILAPLSWRGKVARQRAFVNLLHDLELRFEAMGRCIREIKADDPVNVLWVAHLAAPLARLKTAMEHGIEAAGATTPPHGGGWPSDFLQRTAGMNDSGPDGDGDGGGERREEEGVMTVEGCAQEVASAKRELCAAYERGRSGVYYAADDDGWTLVHENNIARASFVFLALSCADRLAETLADFVQQEEPGNGETAVATAGDDEDHRLESCPQRFRRSQCSCRRRRRCRPSRCCWRCRRPEIPSWGEICPGFKVALAVTGVSQFVLFGLHDSWLWAPVTICMIMSKGTSSSFNTGALRVLGTLLGGIFAYLASQCVAVAGVDRTAGEAAALALWVALTSFARASKRYGYAALVAAFTAPIILFGTYEASDEEAAIMRIEQTLFGVVLYLVIENTLWPNRAKLVLRKRMVASLETCRGFFGEVLDTFEGGVSPLAPPCEKSDRFLKQQLVGVAAQREMVVLADAEPTLWHKPFVAGAYRRLVDRQRDLVHTVFLLGQACGALDGRETAVLLPHIGTHVVQMRQTVDGAMAVVLSTLRALVCSSSTPRGRTVKRGDEEDGASHDVDVSLLSLHSAQIRLKAAGKEQAQQMFAAVTREQQRPPVSGRHIMALNTMEFALELLHAEIVATGHSLRDLVERERLHNALA